jgi:hypothetical protein
MLRVKIFPPEYPLTRWGPDPIFNDYARNSAENPFEMKYQPQTGLAG